MLCLYTLHDTYDHNQFPHFFEFLDYLDILGNLLHNFVKLLSYLVQLKYKNSNIKDKIYSWINLLQRVYKKK